MLKHYDLIKQEQIAIDDTLSLFKYIKEATSTTINKKRSRNVTCDFGPLRKWTNKEKLY